VAEQPVLDLVPFAGAWRKMDNGDGEAGLIRKPLERSLPCTAAIPGAASSIRRNQELPGLWVGLLS